MEWLMQQWEWIRQHETVFAWVGAVSLVSFIVSFIAVPIVIRRMPHDYFLEKSPRTDDIRNRHSFLRLFFHLLKNLIGGILFAGGVLMLLTPGQGVLTMLIGLLLMDFPGKRGLEIRIMRLKPVKKTVDWIRERAEKPPLILPSR